MNEDSGENFLARWSRRKRQTSGEGATPESANETSAKAGTPNDEESVRSADASDDNAVREPSADPDAEASADAPAKDFSKVDFEKLDYDSDYTSFMDKDVPQDIRNKALRKLWVSNPVLANMDGLDDYCEDYTDAAVCLPKGMLKTAYKYGRGFLSDEEVAEWEALGKPEAVATDDEHAPDSDDVDGKAAGEQVVAEAAAETETASGTTDVENSGSRVSGDAAADIVSAADNDAKSV